MTLRASATAWAMAADFGGGGGGRCDAHAHRTARGVRLIHRRRTSPRTAARTGLERHSLRRDLVGNPAAGGVTSAGRRDRSAAHGPERLAGPAARRRRRAGHRRVRRRGRLRPRPTRNAVAVQRDGPHIEAGRPRPFAAFASDNLPAAAVLKAIAAAAAGGVAPRPTPYGKELLFEQAAPASDLLAMACTGGIKINADVRHCAWIAGDNAFGTKGVTADCAGRRLPVPLVRHQLELCRLQRPPRLQEQGCNWLDKRANVVQLPRRRRRDAPLRDDRDELRQPGAGRGP